MKRILAIGRIGGQGMDDDLIERLAIKCLDPINAWEFNAEQRNEALDNIKDAIRGAYNRGRAEVHHARDHADTSGWL